MLNKTELKPNGFRELTEAELLAVCGGYFDEELTDGYVFMRMEMQDMTILQAADHLESLYKSGAFPSPMSADEVRDWCGSTGTEWVPEKVLGTDVSSACMLHDKLYGPDSTTSRLVADAIFAAHILALFTADGKIDMRGAATALVYFTGVRFGGGSAYEGQGSGL